MKPRTQLTIIILILFLVGSGLALYKHFKLGFSFLPKKREVVWTVEATITFTAEGGPAQISVNLPDAGDLYTVLDRKSVTKDYFFELKGGRAVWETENAQGPQTLFFQSTIYRRSGFVPQTKSGMETAPKPVLDGALKTAAEGILATARKAGQPSEKTAALIVTALNDAADPNARRLLADADQFGGKLNLAAGMLNLAGIPARAVRGLNLSESRIKQNLRGYIEIQTDDGLRLLNPRNATFENRNNFVLWSKHDESIMEITGGSGGEISFSTQAGKRQTQRAAIQHGKYSHSLLVDFSIYSLPLSQQNTFKLLLLIPIGALVVVILRNIVGIPTSGTFMPILIALVFLQVNILTGLILFVLIVGIGLVLRSYLSHLNLLLVPRISAVLVFVIIIYVAISVISIKLDIQAGLRVTYFPMIIISWTIERMSILWEEEGPRDVFRQGGGSLISASLIYLAIKNKYVAHLAFSFPELLLVVLAVIILIGSYSGYRLSELRRFEPLVREEQK